MRARWRVSRRIYGVMRQTGGNCEQVHALAEHDQLTFLHDRRHAVHTQRGIAEHEVRASALDRFHVPLMGHASENAHVGIQTAAVHGEITFTTSSCVAG